MGVVPSGGPLSVCGKLPEQPQNRVKLAIRSIAVASQYGVNQLRRATVIAESSRQFSLPSHHFDGGFKGGIGSTWQARLIKERLQACCPTGTDQRLGARNWHVRESSQSGFEQSHLAAASGPNEERGR